MCSQCSNKNSTENDLAEANTKHFNTEAAAKLFEEDWVVALSDKIVNGLKSRKEWLGIQSTETGDDHNPIAAPKGKLLDFACGTGLISKAFYPYFQEVRGIDSAANMVNKYNQTAAELKLDPARMHAVQADLTRASGNSDDEKKQKEDEEEKKKLEQFQNFDLIVISMALHHVSNPLTLLKALVRRLNPNGGKIIIIDWVLPSTTTTASDKDTEELIPNAHSSKFPIAFTGFSERQMKAALTQAGCGATDFAVHPEPCHLPPQTENPWMELFFALGRK